MKNILCILGLTAALISLSSTTSARPVDCLLEVDGKTYIKGICEFKAQKGGDFQISGKEYFAQLTVHSKNEGSVNWNASPNSTHAQAYLGDVKRKGACWEGRRVKVCARNLSKAQQAEVKKGTEVTVKQLPINTVKVNAWATKNRQVTYDDPAPAAPRATAPIATTMHASSSEFGAYTAIFMNKVVVKAVSVEGSDIYVKLASGYQQAVVKLSDAKQAKYRKWSSGSVEKIVKVYNSNRKNKKGYTYRVNTSATFIEYHVDGQLVLHLKKK